MLFKLLRDYKCWHYAEILIENNGHKQQILSVKPDRFSASYVHTNQASSPFKKRPAGPHINPESKAAGLSNFWS